MTSKVKEAQKEYKKTELGEIPADWEVKKLIELSIGKGEYGIGASAVDYCVDKPRYLRITDIDEMGRLSNKDIRGFDSEIYDNYVLQKGDILFARTGNTTGKSYLYKESDGQLVFAGFLIRFRVNPKIADERYVFHYVQTNGYWNWVKKMSMRSGQPGINSNQYSELLIPLPKLKEQQKIAEILSTVDEQIENIGQLLNKTKEFKKGLMQQLLINGIGHTKFKQTELGEIPVEWEIYKMEDLCERIIVGIASSTSEYYTNEKNSVPIIRNQNIKENKIDANDLLYITKEFDIQNKKKRLRKGDLLTVRTGYPGITAVVTSALVDCQSFTTLISSPYRDKVSSNYLAYYLNSPFGKNELEKISAGGAQQNLNVSSLSKFLVKFPDIKEQQKIAEILSTVDEQIENYEQEKEKYEKVKKGLMQKLLTGKLRVTV